MLSLLSERGAISGVHVNSAVRVEGESRVEAGSYALSTLR